MAGCASFEQARALQRATHLNAEAGREGADATKSRFLSLAGEFADIQRARALQAADRLAEPERAIRKALSLAPRRATARADLPLVPLAQGRGEEAMAEAIQEPEAWSRLLALTIMHHAAGRRAESDRALRELIAKFAGDAACQIAEVHAVRGPADASFEWLERAYAQRDAGPRG